MTVLYDLNSCMAKSMMARSRILFRSCEIEFAALMAQHYRIRVISSESEAKQITALCKGKSESYVTHAFMFFACRDLIRFRDSGNGDDQAINAELGVTNQVKHLNKLGEKNMFGSTELIVIALIIFVLFGAAAIPKFAKSLGEAKKEFDKGLKTDSKIK